MGKSEADSNNTVDEDAASEQGGDNNGLVRRLDKVRITSGDSEPDQNENTTENSTTEKSIKPNSKLDNNGNKTEDVAPPKEKTIVVQDKKTHNEKNMTNNILNGRGVLTQGDKLNLIKA